MFIDPKDSGAFRKAAAPAEPERQEPFVGYTDSGVLRVAFWESYNCPKETMRAIDSAVAEHFKPRLKDPGIPLERKPNISDYIYPKLFESELEEIFDALELAPENKERFLGRFHEVSRKSMEFYGRATRSANREPSIQPVSYPEKNSVTAALIVFNRVPCPYH